MSPEFRKYAEMIFAMVTDVLIGNITDRTFVANLKVAIGKMEKIQSPPKDE